MCIDREKEKDREGGGGFERVFLTFVLTFLQFLFSMKVESRSF